MRSRLFGDSSKGWLNLPDLAIDDETGAILYSSSGMELAPPGTYQALLEDRLCWQLGAALMMVGGFLRGAVLMTLKRRGA